MYIHQLAALTNKCNQGRQLEVERFSALIVYKPGLLLVL